jgi:lipopolysaccharide export system permease protein
MSLLSRYVIRTVIGYTGLVMIILLILCGLYLFITQQDDIGVGNYQTVDALMFMLLYLPEYGFELLPIGALIGSLIGLGNLARSSELVVMRSSGTSVYRIASWVASAGVFLAVITWVVGDYVAPQLRERADQQKTQAKFNQFVRAGDQSVWARDNDTFISVRQQRGEDNFGGLYVFEFNDQHELKRMVKADGARLITSTHWQLQNFGESSFEGDRVIAVRKPSADFETHLSPEFLNMSTIEPSSMSSTALYRYVTHLKANDVEARSYETEFWARISRTVSLIVVVMLAVPFALGPLRSTGAGARTVVGILIGAAFFLLASVLESGGQVFNLTPVEVAWAPTILMTVVTFAALFKVR